MSLRLPEDKYAALCKAILQRDGYKCRSCGMRSGLACHHVIFRSQQGEDTADNLVTLCGICHSGVHTAVHNGEYGLVITSDTNGFTFKRANWWRPA